MINYAESVRQIAEGDQHYELWLLLSRARYAVYRAREKELLRYAVTPEQAQVLAIIHNTKGKISLAELARLILLQPNTASSLIDRMEKKGLVKKAQNLTRKNMFKLSLTEKGKLAYKLTSKRGPIHRVMRVLNEGESEQLRQILNKIMFQASDELGLTQDPLPSSD